MRLKNSIDRRFMDKFQSVAAMDQDEDDPMQCRGCGCKLGGDALQSALAGENGTEIKLEDAAEIGGDSPHRLIASTDFFSSPMDDAFLSGRVAALHAASDIIATGAKPTDALANVVLPEGDSGTQQRVLRDFLSGSRLEFDAMGASIVGGHTIVGPRMEVGFTVIGQPISGSLMRKENLLAGDRLFLTKPLGIGILLAAHARGLCAAAHFESLVEAMLIRQHDLAQITIDCDIHAGTDVTGFGLAGHLLEMLETSGAAARVFLDAIPLLPGARETIERGIESSLAPENRRIQTKISARSSQRETAAYKVLFDPQTCGGLLLGVAAEKSERLLEAFRRAKLPAPVCIGDVISPENGRKPLTIE
jgi:selenide,water dikinase